MTRPLLLIPAFLAPALFLAAPASAEPAERAVAQCRAEMLSRFAENEVSNYRVASIAGNSRRTRVSFIVNADRRYTFECAADADGRILTAAFDPPRPGGPQLAAGEAHGR